MNELQRQIIRSRQIRIDITQTLVSQLVSDKRYRCLVTLMRSDRPNFWIFSCVNSDCNAKIVEIQNLDAFAINDFFDPQNINNTGIGKHCKGTLASSGLPCNYSYFFNIQ